jgi:hypothetical protein
MNPGGATVDGAVLLDQLDELAATARTPAGGVTRLAWSAEDRTARALISKWAASGCATRSGPLPMTSTARQSCLGPRSRVPRAAYRTPSWPPPTPSWLSRTWRQPARPK